MARRSTKQTGPNIDGRLARTVRTRDQIVDTLLQLVQEGAHGATLAEIAARAGVTQRTLFNHFPNIGDAVGAALMRSREVSLSLLPCCAIEHVLAQVQVTYSNSMLEAFWRSLKHPWLYLNALDSMASVRSLVALFVEPHNTVMPHCAFDGQTPAEMFIDGGVPAQLAAPRSAARATRLAWKQLRR